MYLSRETRVGLVEMSAALRVWKLISGASQVVSIMEEPSRRSGSSGVNRVMCSIDFRFETIEAEQGHRTRLDIKRNGRTDPDAPSFPCRTPRIHDELPFALESKYRHREREHLIVGIDQNKQRIALDMIAAFIHLVDGISAKEHAQASGVRVVPVLFFHVSAVRPEPAHIPDLRLAHRAAPVESPAHKHRVLPTELDEKPGEFEQFLPATVEFPVNP